MKEVYWGGGVFRTRTLDNRPVRAVNEDGSLVTVEGGEDFRSRLMVYSDEPTHIMLRISSSMFGGIVMPLDIAHDYFEFSLCDFMYSIIMINTLIKNLQKGVDTVD